MRRAFDSVEVTVKGDYRTLILFYDSPATIRAMHKPISHILHSFLLLVLIGTYGSIVYTLKTAPSAPPVTRREATPVSSRSAGTSETNADTGWSLIQPGLERRVMTIYSDQKQPVESLHIWRLDQKYFRLDVAFDGTPKSLETWQKETNAAMVVNGGYFSINNERYSADGLSILNGKASGRSFNGFGGMLAIAGG